MVQNYNNYLTYANKLLFFLPERRFFAHIVYYLCAAMRLAGAKVQQKKQGRKDFLLCAPISPKKRYKSDNLQKEREREKKQKRKREKRV